MEEPNPRPKTRLITKRVSMLTRCWIQGPIAGIWQGSISNSTYKLSQIFLKLFCKYEGSQRCLVIVISYHHCHFFEAIWSKFDYSLLFSIFIALSDWVCFDYISYNCIASNTCFVSNGECNFLQFILIPRR